MRTWSEDNDGGRTGEPPKFLARQVQSNREPFKIEGFAYTLGIATISR